MPEGVRKTIVRTTTAHKFNLLRKQKDLLHSCCSTIHSRTQAISQSSATYPEAERLKVTAEEIDRLRLTD